MEKTNRKFASEDIVAIEELAKQLAAELNVDDDTLNAGDGDETQPIVEDNGVAEEKPVVAEEELDIVKADEEPAVAPELPDDKEVVADHDVQDILKEADELEDEIDRIETATEADELEKKLQACEEPKKAEKCPECGEEECKCASEKTASETAPGIEDKIGDEANGGDPSVSELPDTKIDCETDKEVFGQNSDSEYIARITARLDRVADALDARGMKRMAFRVDQLSDKLEASIR